MALRLELIQDTAYTAASALQAQAADRDVSIAKVIQRHIGDALEDEIERLRGVDSDEGDDVVTAATGKEGGAA